MDKDEYSYSRSPEIIKNLEKELNDFQKREELFYTILENVSSGVAVIDDTGKFFLYNKEFLRLFGLSENSTIRNVNDQKWSDWKVFDENADILNVDEHPVRKVVLTGEKVKNQVVGVILPSGGDMIWMLVSAEPLYKKNKELDKIICTYQDFTENKIADEILLKNEDRMRLTIESADLGTWDLDLETGETIHSLRHDQIFGFAEAQEDWNIEIALKYILPEDHHIVIDSLKQGETIGHTSFEVRVKWPDDSLHWIAVNGRTHYDRKGKPVRMIGIVADVTKRKLAEKAIIESEKNLRELNATKDKFFSIIAHDLKSPFNSIIGFTELLIERFQEKDFTKFEEFLNIILKSSNRALNLLTNLFEWARLQTGSLKFSPEIIDLVPIIEEITELLKSSSDQKSINLKAEISPLCLIKADEFMISTIIRNLVSNAIKFTPVGGTVTISAYNDDNDIIITVKDTGIGLEENEIKKLFKIETIYSSKGTMGEEGTGLGLLLCKEFISKHDGNIHVESKPGKGSAFSFNIPIKE